MVRVLKGFVGDGGICVGFHLIRPIRRRDQFIVSKDSSGQRINNGVAATRLDSLYQTIDAIFSKKILFYLIEIGLLTNTTLFNIFNNQYYKTNCSRIHHNY